MEWVFLITNNPSIQIRKCF